MVNKYLSTLFLLLLFGLNINSQTENKEYDISALNIDEIHAVEISDNGKGLLINYTAADGSAYIFHNGTNYGPLDKYSYFDRQDKRISTDGKYFYVKYSTASNTSFAATVNGFSEERQMISDEGYLNENGDAAYAFIEGDQLFIQTWSGVKGPIDSAEYLASFRMYDDGFAAAAYLHNREDHIYFDGKIIGPVENVSVNSIEFPEGKKIYAYRQGEERGDNFYVIGDKKYGPYKIGSDHITFGDNASIWGFIYKKEGKAFVKINGKDFGPFPNFDFATNLEIFNNDPAEFAYFYMVENDTSLYLQRSDSEVERIDVPSLKISRPIFSDDGDIYKFIERSPEGNYTRINDRRFGPYGSESPSFYSKKLYGGLREFKFRKHNKTFLKAADNYLGPYQNFDYIVNGNNFYLAYIGDDKKTAGILTSPVSEINDIKGLESNGTFTYTAEISNKTVSFDIPFSWNSLNVFKQTRLFPAVLLYRNKMNVEKFLNTLLENGKLSLNDNKAILVAALGGLGSNMSLTEFADQQLNQLKDVEVITEPSEIDLNGNQIIYSELKSTATDSDDVYAKLMWWMQNNELIYTAVYQTKKPEEKFDNIDEMVLTTIKVTN